MRFLTVALLLMGSAMVGSSAYAGADDAKWVAQCIKDNSDAKVGPEVVKSYCACMNNKMDDNETKTISQWEKTHKTEMEACEKSVGWDK